MIDIALSFRHCSQAHTIKPARVRKKELVVNSKYGPVASDPMYENLVFSTEVEVFLTAKRGKAWCEMMAAKKIQAENELRARQRAAQASPTPLALQYLYGGAQKVQREGDVTRDKEIEVQGEVVGQLEGKQEKIETVYPYAVYDEVVCDDSDDIHNTNESDLNTTKHDTPIDDKSQDTLNPRLGRRVKVRNSSSKTSRDIPPVEASDRLEYERISDPLHSAELRSVFTEDHLFKYGTADPTLPGASTSVPCGGCGASLHCLDEKIPGFVPSQILAGRGQGDLRSILCQRCYIIKEYKVALKVNVSPEDYPRAIEHIKDKQALVLLVVDLLDFPGSVWPGILDLLGTNKKVILVGNKFDMIVPDSAKYYKKITNIMRSEFLSKCWREGTSGESSPSFPQIVGSCCVSATTGFNMETLVEQIFSYWKDHNNALPGDIYIVGCTNVGKSSLFNTLLDSDLCKVTALSLVQKAMTSPVPGTTLNLLKFPLSRPEPHFLANRHRRVTLADVQFRKLENDRRKALMQSRDISLAVPSHYAIKHTLGEGVRQESKTTEGGLYTNTVELEKVEGVGLPVRLDPDEKLWGKHCHDTPGTVSQDQIINLLTAEEIGRVLPARPLQPRTLLLRQGHTLLLGGLARLDLVQAGHAIHPVRITVFCSSDLPINMVLTEGVEKFLLVTRGTKLMGVPEGRHREDLPPMKGIEVEVAGSPGSGRGLISGGGWVGSADIVLSSCGWVMVSPREEENCTFMAYTIGGKGISKRVPFLPHSINLRGKRVQGSPSFRNDRVFVP